MKNQKRLLFGVLCLFLAFNTLLCVKSLAQTVEVGICDARINDECCDDEGIPLQPGAWVEEV